MAGVYIHIPFCSAKCDYCDFFSVVVPDAVRRPVMTVLLEQIERMPVNDIATVYMGGGNPGLLSDCELIKIFETANRVWRLLPGVEWTVEMRPETVTRARLDLLRGLGVTRISVGVQSFNADERAALGRGGTNGDLRRTLELLGAEWPNWNLDLIYGIPGQDIGTWDASLSAARSYRPQHLSLYDLTLGEESPLARRVNEGSASLPTEEDTVLMLQHAQTAMAAAGYEQYEISNWSQTGFRCEHNLNYWRGCDYLGIGPGAVTTWHGDRWRWTEDLAAFLASKGTAREEVECLDEPTRRQEALMLGLRVADGIDRVEFATRFGIDPVIQAPGAVERWRKSGDLAFDELRLWITPQGMRWSNSIIADLLD